MEHSKLFKQLGHKVGINPVKFTHRGIIARRIIEHINTLELNEFKAGFKKIDLTIKGIKVNTSNGTYYI